MRWIRDKIGEAVQFAKNSGKAQVFPNTESPSDGPGFKSVVSTPLDRFITYDRLLEEVVSIHKERPPLAEMLAFNKIDVSEHETEITQTVKQPDGKDVTTRKIVVVDREKGRITCEERDEKNCLQTTNYTIILKDPLRVECFQEIPDRRISSDPLLPDVTLDAIDSILSGRQHAGMLYGLRRKVRFFGNIPSMIYPEDDGRCFATENLYKLLPVDITDKDIIERIIEIWKIEKVCEWVGAVHKFKLSYDDGKKALVEVTREAEPGSDRWEGAFSCKLTRKGSDGIHMETFLADEAAKGTRVDDCTIQVYRGYKELRIEFWKSYGDVQEGGANPDTYAKLSRTYEDVIWPGIHSLMAASATDQGDIWSCRVAAKSRVIVNWLETNPKLIVPLHLAGVTDFDAVWESHLGSCLHPIMESTLWTLSEPPELTVDVPDTQWTVVTKHRVGNNTTRTQTTKVVADKATGTITMEASAEADEQGKKVITKVIDRVLKDSLSIESTVSLSIDDVESQRAVLFGRMLALQNSVNNIAGFWITAGFPLWQRDQPSLVDSSKLSFLSTSLDPLLNSDFSGFQVLWLLLTQGLLCLQCGLNAFNEEFGHYTNCLSNPNAYEAISCSHDELKMVETYKGPLGGSFGVNTNSDWKATCTWRLDQDNKRITTERTIDLETGEKRILDSVTLQIHEDPLRLEAWKEKFSCRVSDGIVVLIMHGLLNEVLNRVEQTKS